MYEHENKQIAELSAKIGDIENKARNFNRAMSAKEAGIVAELEQAIEKIRMELPTSAPLSLQNFGGGTRALSGHNGGSSHGFENVGEILQALYKRSKGEGMDPRLEPLQVRAGINESTPSQGGFAVPEQLIYKSFTENLQDTVLLQLCDKVPMTTDKLGIPIFGDDNHSTSAPFGITWDQIPESGTFGDFQSVPFKKLNLVAHKSGALFSASNEWLSDADPAMRARLETIFQSSLRWYCESKLWNGTGAGVALGALVGDGALSITKEVGQTADTIQTENILKQWARLRPGSHNRAIWAANPTTFPMLATLSISVGTGGSVVSLLQPSGIAGGPATSILGRPLYLSEHLPALGNAGDICLLDPMLYVLGDRKQIIVDASPHIRFQYDETAFRVQARFDGQPALSGSTKAAHTLPGSNTKASATAGHTTAGSPRFPSSRSRRRLLMRYAGMASGTNCSSHTTRARRPGGASRNRNRRSSGKPSDTFQRRSAMRDTCPTRCKIWIGPRMLYETQGLC